MNSDIRRSYTRARSGSEEDYLAVIKRYEALVFGYFRVSAPLQVTEAMNATQQVFFRLWEDLGSYSKIGEFEAALVETLVSRDLGAGLLSPDPRIAALGQLSAQDRVIALAVEIGNWSVESAAKAFGVSRSVMARDLLRIRCDLIGLHFINLTEDEKKVLREVSTHLCRDLSKKQRQKMAEATCRSPELRDFKARCLEKRCEMVELWLDFRLTPEEQAWLLEGILDLIRREREKKAALRSHGLRWMLPLRRRKKALLN
ncbi:RNA polymerase sigma factor [Puniceicoccus vermicola]|uniref:Uncharacterized protein n=1 Tax=Puniceicoccus vermicola TaxID=388746 RepID=A0A7X1AXL0_9BACT|nr:hypothetical protein [Puniceicoccus vermicola]MBC2600675.1 hypothetical protein [Puniceicoccus vermicola]